MRSIKSVLVALLAVFALGMVAAGGASAHEYFIEGKSMKELGLKEEAVSSTLGKVVLEVNGGVKIECAENSGSGTIKQGGGNSISLDLGGCFIPHPAGCLVAEPLVISGSGGGLVEVEGKLADSFTTASESERLFTLDIKHATGSSCSIAGEYAFFGHITGLVVSESEKETVELSFTRTSGSEFTDSDIGIIVFKDNLKLSGANKSKKWAAKK